MPRHFFRGCFLSLLLFASAAATEDAVVFTGRVTDVEGHPVAGARIFVYGSPEVRRNADYISPSTDGDGRFRMVLPRGKYWSIARLKKSGEYGPLMPGDKYSGEPEEIELGSGPEAVLDFTVADIRDALQKKAGERERPALIRGRILDEKGTPIAGAYAFATRSATLSGIPEHLSASADDTGGYALYLPRGRYYLGAALRFPPGQAYFLRGEMTISGDLSGIDIIRPSGTAPKEDRRSRENQRLSTD